MPSPATITSEQNLQVVVSGPGDVTAMHVVTGIANAQLSASAPAGGFVQQQGTFTAHVGLPLTAEQFRKAVASAAITSLAVSGIGPLAKWELIDVDADFDDEAGRVKLSYELRISFQAAAGTGISGVITSVGFQVMILAAQ